MKKTKKLVVLLTVVIMLTTGCTHSFKDEDTNKTYTENILCKPTDKESIEAYKKLETIDLEKLPDCEKLKVTSGGYEGLWTNIFVKPLAWLIVKVGLILKNYGYSIIILGILLRLLVLPFTKQTLDMSENMKKANPELKSLEKKYANRTDKESMLRKNQEMLLIYKKYNIKPLSGCLVSLIQLPLFFAFLEAIQRIPAILEETTFGLDLGTTPWASITSGEYYYIIIVILIALSTYYSFKNTTSASINEEAAAQTKMMTKFMVVFITIMSFSLNVGIALYWFATNAFAILQNYLLKKLREKKEKK